MKNKVAAPSLAFVFLAAVAGIALFSIMDAVMKGLVLAIGAYTTLFWRSLAGAFISGVLYCSRRRARITRQAVHIHVIRGVVTTAMAVAFFWGLARMPMAQAVALTFIAPLLSLYLSAIMLGERIRFVTIVASVIAFVGVVVILVGQWRSDLGPDALRGAIAVLASAVAYAFNIVLMRRQALVADPVEVAFSQSLVVAIVLGIGAPMFATVPPLEHVPTLVFAAILAVLSLQLLAWAYARSDASHLSTSEYTSFVWAAVLGWLIFDEQVSVFTLVGAAFIVVGCIVAARRRPAPAQDGIEALH